MFKDVTGEGSVRDTSPEIEPSNEADSLDKYEGGGMANHQFIGKMGIIPLEEECSI